MTQKKPGASLTTKILLFFNGVVASILLLSYLAAYIRPEDFWPIAFLGLAYPILLFLNFLFLIFWLVAWKKYFWISALAVLVGINHVGNLLQINKVNMPLPESGKNLKVLSYNVRNFGLYSYLPGWQLNFTYRDKIFSYLDKKDADIVCFQEFVFDRKGQFRTLDTLTTFMRARYAHFEYTRVSRYENYFGVATFSSYPIVNRGKILFRTNAGNLCIYTDIKVGYDTIRVYNLHLESIGLSHEDHLFVENMINTLQDEHYWNFTANSRIILRRLKRAFIWRASQAEKVAEHIKKSPHPVILAGDFNDTPTSYVYYQLTQVLYDAFKSGLGMGRTYLIAIPGFRIDYIMHSAEFTPVNFRTGNQEYSDHFPVSVVLNFQSTGK
ncbi:MAG TPA: endonuclease/exonuclease/phosphatase family protein [Bacteroidales bacterium]|nr:endonuclease/exonuclease/phosphatase family protein [Bacteroidales bacterium]